MPDRCDRESGEPLAPEVQTDEGRTAAGTSKQDSSGVNELMVMSVFKRTLGHGTCTYTPASVHMTNTTARMRGIANMLLCPFREVSEYIIGGDFTTSA